MQTLPNRKLRGYVAMAVTAFLGASLFGPMLFKERDVPSALPGGYAHADNVHSVRIETGTVLFEHPRVVIERGTLSLAPPRPGGVLSEQEIVAHLRDGSAELFLDDGKVLIDQTSTPGSQTAPAVDSVLAAVANLSFTKLAARDLKVVAKREGAEAFLVGRLTCEIVKSPAQVQAKGTFERSGITLPFDFTLNTQTAAAGRLPIKAKVSSELLSGSLTGELVRGKDFALTAPQATFSSPHAKDVLHWLVGEPIAGHGLEEFRVTGALDWTDHTFAFQGADFMIDGNEAKGGLSFNLAGPRPLLEGTLAFSNLELAPYVRPLPASVPGLTDNVLSWSRWLIGDYTPGSLIRDLDADMRISATSVTSNGAILGRGAATLTLKDARLLADLAEIELEDQAQGDARITVDLTGEQPRYELRGMLEAADFGQVSSVATGNPLVQGAGTVNVDLKASGSSQGEFRKTLTGTATLAMPEGARISVDLASLLNSAKSGGLGWGPAMHGTTNVDQLDAKFQAANGLLTASSIEALTSSHRLLAIGTLNMSDQMLDFSIAATPIDAASSGDTSQKVRIVGPLLAPVIRLDAPSKAAIAPEQRAPATSTGQPG